ncbi:E3 ubiquitin-protein ligase pub1 [Coemansia sp. RSA 1813]|nr:E3 ubiquitin-protein ligase pub1 [Coemansia sp. RSA 1813]
MLSAKANADVGPISKIDTICDFLEVYIHAILYNRNVYPKSFFEDRYAYGIPLHKCESPGDVKIDIIDDNDITIESFVLELSVLSGNYNMWVSQMGGPLTETACELRLIPLGSVDSADLKASSRQHASTTASMQMMEGPPAPAQTNGAVAPGANGMYAAQQQQHQQVAPMNGGPMQYAPPQTPTDPSVKSLYVGNLDPNITEQILREAFSSVRPVVSVKIIPDRRQASGGLNYGFVEFADHQDANIALQNLNGRRIFECEIRVNWALNNGSQTHEDTSNHFHVFVGDLSAEVNDQMLTKAFGAYPSMSCARVMWDMSSWKSRGYGFVAFRDRADAETAISQMNGEWLGSRAIRVNWASQKASAKARHDAASNSGSSSNGGGHPHQHQQQPLSYETVCSQTAQYNTTAYMGNLTNYTTQDQLQAVFQPFGFVMEIRMQLERGYAFIKMDTHENAAMAITQLNGSVLNGRPVRCSWGKDRVPDPKSAFGSAVAAAAGNPAYSYPYVYGMPPQQQFGVPGAAAGSQQPQPSANNPQGWNGFGYESYGYYANPNFPQPGQMMPPTTVSGGVAPPGAMSGGGANLSQTSENGY